MSQSNQPRMQSIFLPTTNRCYQRAHDLVLDYALGAAILGLNPFPNLFLVTLLLVGILLFKMRHDIAKLWDSRRRRGFWAIADGLLGLVGALSMAFMAWLTVIVASAFIPVVHRFAIPAALFTLVWMSGFAVNHSYLVSLPTTPRSEETLHG
ncbi:MAG: hypothetical protein ACFB8W_13660 [Elainellaceae cyanobacterium]